MLMVECKAKSGASISFNEIRQYEKMKDYRELEKTYPGVLVWFYEKDTIIWVSINEMVKMKEEGGEKSIGLRMLKEDYPQKYRIINVPATKLRTFMEADLKYLVEVLNGERS